MSEREMERQQLATKAVDPKLYYDYEGRFIRQRLERDWMRMQPHVVKPGMFAKGGHALGDVRVFERFTIGPISSMTCGFVELRAGESTPAQRRTPSMVGYVVAGSGATARDGASHDFTAGDVVFVPPYTTYTITAGPDGLTLFVPEARIWHVLGLLHEEHHEQHRMPGEVEPVTDRDGRWSGYRVDSGVLGLESELNVHAGAEPHREAVFAARRAVTEEIKGETWYDDMLRLLVTENRVERDTPRVIRGADLPFERTRQGRLKYYLTNWSEVAGHDMDLAVYEIPGNAHTGRHRHVAEELLYVLSGSGHDEHEGTTYEWAAGDLVCVPPMTAHQHFNDGPETARLVSVWTRQPANEYFGGIEHISDATPEAD